MFSVQFRGRGDACGHGIETSLFINLNFKKLVSDDLKKSFNDILIVSDD